MLSDAPITPTIPATDLNRAKQFYSEKLGLKESAMSGMEGTALFDCGQGSVLFIYERPTAGTAEHTLASFMVKDLVAEMTDLRARGVVFEEYDMPGLKTENGMADSDGMKSAWFKDTEGNILNIVQK